VKCEGWCAECYSNRRGRSNYRGHWGYRRYDRSLSWEVLAVLKKPTGSLPGVPARAFDVSTDEVLRDLPSLASFLCDVTWEDGSDRVPGTVLLFVQDGRIKACLNDKASSRVCFLTAQTVLDVLHAADEAVDSGHADWRPVQTTTGSRRR
jgi:hypothetical protein